jgi:surface-adhesin protein E
MRTPIFVLALLLSMSAASFAQTANNEILGGKVTDKPANAPATKKPAAKPAANRDRPLYSPCGVYYQNRADMTRNSILPDKWFSLGQSANKHFWYNPRKTTCDAKTAVLNSWIKEEHKNTDGDYALVLYEMKCKPNQLRVKTVIEYDKNGSVLDTNNNAETPWQDAAPATAGEVMLRTACRRP